MKNFRTYIISLFVLPLIVFSVTVPASAGDTNVFRLYSPERDEHFYTTSDAERISQTCTDPQPKYAVTRMPSLIFYAELADSAVNLPVYRLYNPKESDHLYTISYQEKEFAIENGYLYEGIPFYAYETQPSGGIPIYRRYFPEGSSHTYNLQDYPTGSYGGDEWFISEGVAFWVDPSASDPIYTLFNNIDRTQLLATYNEIEEINCLKAYYHNEGIAFSVYSTNGPNRLAFDRFAYWNQYPHAYTADESEKQVFTNYNMTNEGLAFYADPTATLPVYRLSKQHYGYPVPSYLFTTSIEEKTYAMNNGYAYEGIAFSADPKCTVGCTNTLPND